MSNAIQTYNPTENIVVYHSTDHAVQLDVQLAEDTVWLSQKQMAQLFDTTSQNITLHIGNIYREQELIQSATCKDFLQVQEEGGKEKRRLTKFYNLDVIISVGYRVKSKRGTQFRQWANIVLKNYLLHGYAISNRLENLEQRVTKTEQQIKYFVRTSLPPREGIFADGQIYDAFEFIERLIKSAQKSLLLIDNYVDDSVLTMLDKRNKGVDAVVYTKNISRQLSLDFEKHNAQYSPIEVKQFDRAHDRFLCIDDTVYLIGASLKDLGKKWFGFVKLEQPTDELLSKM